ncbi:hypothetical protein Tco_1357602, partial [Tanacetum coccineum]
LKSKTIEDIISIGSFIEVLVLNNYVLVRKILMASLDDDDDLGFLDNLALELRFYVMKVRLWLRPSMESKRIRSIWTMRKMLEVDTELKHVEPLS